MTTQERVNAERWHIRYEVVPGVWTPGVDDGYPRVQHMGIPEDLTGKRVLEIGCLDGFWTFLCEDRGASVTAVDVVNRPAFRLAMELRQSKARYVVTSVYDLPKYPLTWHGYDVVLFMGVFYHLRHPLLALETLRELIAPEGLMIVESYMLPQGAPVMMFYPGNELNNDKSNWWGPTATCLKLMLESSGFTANQYSTYRSRVVFHCTPAERQTGREFIGANIGRAA